MKALSDNPALLFLLGGLLTFASAVLGGYVGSRLLIRNDKKAQKRELIGAIHVTRSELARNATTIHWRLDTDHRQPLLIVLSDASFRSVEPILARHLPTTLFGWIGVINDQVARYQHGIEEARKRANGGLDPADEEIVRDLRERLLVANRLLLRYIRETLKSKVPTLDAADSDTPQEIEQELGDHLFRKRSLIERLRDWIDRHRYKETAG